MNIIAYNTFMINAGSSVNNTVTSYSGIGLNNAALHYYTAISDVC